jgi:hypothetical protein
MMYGLLIPGNFSHMVYLKSWQTPGTSSCFLHESSAETALESTAVQFTPTVTTLDVPLPWQPLALWALSTPCDSLEPVTVALQWQTLAQLLYFSRETLGPVLLYARDNTGSFCWSSSERTLSKALWLNISRLSKEQLLRVYRKPWNQLQYITLDNPWCTRCTYCTSYMPTL